MYDPINVILHANTRPGNFTLITLITLITFNMLPQLPVLLSLETRVFDYMEVDLEAAQALETKAALVEVSMTTSEA